MIRATLLVPLICALQSGIFSEAFAQGRGGIRAGGTTIHRASGPGTSVFSTSSRGFSRQWGGYHGSTVWRGSRGYVGGYGFPYAPAYGAYYGPVVGFSVNTPIFGTYLGTGFPSQGVYVPGYGDPGGMAFPYQPAPFWTGPNPFDNEVLGRSLQENNERWNGPVIVGQERLKTPPPPSTPDARLKSLQAQGQGDAYMVKQLFAHAFGRYKVAASLAPDRAEPLFRLAWANVAMKRFEAAAEQFRRGLDLSPDYPKTGASLATLMGDENQLAYQVIKERVVRWAGEDVRDPERLFVAGMVMYSEGDTRSPLMFETALRLAGRSEPLETMLKLARAGRAGDPSSPPAAHPPATDPRDLSLQPGNQPGLRRNPPNPADRNVIIVPRRPGATTNPGNRFDSPPARVPPRIPPRPENPLDGDRPPPIPMPPGGDRFEDLPRRVAPRKPSETPDKETPPEPLLDSPALPGRGPTAPKDPQTVPGPNARPGFIPPLPAPQVPAPRARKSVDLEVQSFDSDADPADKGRDSEPRGPALIPPLP